MKASTSSFFGRRCVIYFNILRTFTIYARRINKHEYSMEQTKGRKNDLKKLEPRLKVYRIIFLLVTIFARQKRIWIPIRAVEKLRTWSTCSLARKDMPERENRQMEFALIDTWHFHSNTILCKWLDLIRIVSRTERPFAARFVLFRLSPK